MLQSKPYISEWSALLPNVMVTSGSELQLRAVSGFKALLQPRSVLMSKALVTMEGHGDVCDLGPCWWTWGRADLSSWHCHLGQW